MKRIIAALILLLLVAAVIWWLLAPAPAQMGQRPPTVVNLAPAIERQLSDTVEVVGDARALEAITLMAEVPGRVRALHFEEGQQVEAGALLLELDDRSARAELAQQQAAYQRARQDYQRAQQLVGGRAISQSEVDGFKTTLDGAQANLNRARASLDDHRIKAPFAGVIGLRQVDVGSYLNSGDLVATLDNLQAVEVEFQVPERYLSRLQQGLQVEARSDAWPEQGFVGTITHLDSRIQRASRSITARARLDNEGARTLRQGQFLRVTITLAERIASLVPEQAIITQGAQSYVFTVVDEQAQRQPVTLGGRRDGWVEIRGGLPAGSEVIVNGHSRLGSGDPVRVLENPEALLPDQRVLLQAGPEPETVAEPAAANGASA